MSKFKEPAGRIAPKIVTSALPDIIFMLLFFFMFVTVLREHQLLVKVDVPTASEIEKLKHRSLVNHIYIGRPIQLERGTTPVIQINDSFVKVNDLKRAVSILKETKPAYQQHLITNSLIVDQEISMGIVSDVKTELRKANQLKVNYAAVNGER